MVGNSYVDSACIQIQMPLRLPPKLQHRLKREKQLSDTAGLKLQSSIGQPKALLGIFVESKHGGFQSDWWIQLDNELGKFWKGNLDDSDW